MSSVLGMADFFDDPDYPNRPKHLDYYRLMEVVNYFDGESEEGGRSFEDITAAWVDAESLTYMAMQRALRMQQQTGLPVEALAPVWMDAFLAGARFEREGGHRAG